MRCQATLNQGSCEATFYRTLSFSSIMSNYDTNKHQTLSGFMLFSTMCRCVHIVRTLCTQHMMFYVSRMVMCYSGYVYTVVFFTMFICTQHRETEHIAFSMVAMHITECLYVKLKILFELHCSNPC